MITNENDEAEAEKPLADLIFDRVLGKLARMPEVKRRMVCSIITSICLPGSISAEDLELYKANLVDLLGPL